MFSSKSRPAWSKGLFSKLSLFDSYSYWRKQKTKLSYFWWQFPPSSTALNSEENDDSADDHYRHGTVDEEAGQDGVVVRSDDVKVVQEEGRARQAGDRFAGGIVLAPLNLSSRGKAIGVVWLFLFLTLIFNWYFPV